MPLLYESGDHAVHYFRSITPKGAVQANQYVIKNGEEGLLLDPGGRIVSKSFWGS